MRAVTIGIKIEGLLESSVARDDADNTVLFSERSLKITTGPCTYNE